MSAAQLKKKFNKADGPVVLPVIPILDEAQVIRNVKISVEAGADGVFLINEDYGLLRSIPIIKAVRTAFPDIWLGVNFFMTTFGGAVSTLADLQAEGIKIDGYWTDLGEIDEWSTEQPTAQLAQDLRKKHDWKGLFFGGVDYKNQRQVQPDKLETAARIAAQYMDVVTTTGTGVSVPPEVPKLQDMRSGAGLAPIAVASGLDANNIGKYLPCADCFLVSRKLSKKGDGYDFDEAKVKEFVQKCA